MIKRILIILLCFFYSQSRAQEGCAFDLLVAEYQVHNALVVTNSGDFFALTINYPQYTYSQTLESINLTKVDKCGSKIWRYISDNFGLNNRVSVLGLIEEYNGDIKIICSSQGDVGVIVLNTNGKFLRSQNFGKVPNVKGFLYIKPNEYMFFYSEKVDSFNVTKLKALDELGNVLMEKKYNLDLLNDETPLATCKLLDGKIMLLAESKDTGSFKSIIIDTLGNPIDSFLLISPNIINYPQIYIDADLNEIVVTSSDKHWPLTRFDMKGQLIKYETVDSPLFTSAYRILHLNEFNNLAINEKLNSLMLLDGNFQKVWDWTLPVKMQVGSTIVSAQQKVAILGTVYESSGIGHSTIRNAMLCVSDKLIGTRNLGLAQISNIDVEGGYKIFPNPINKIFTISNVKPTKVSLLTINGIMLENLVCDDEDTYHINEHLNGLYLLKIENEYSVEYKKIIIAN